MNNVLKGMVVAVLAIVISGCTNKVQNREPIDLVHTKSDFENELKNKAKMDKMPISTNQHVTIWKSKPSEEWAWYPWADIFKSQKGALCQSGEFRELKTYDDIYSFTHSELQAKAQLTDVELEVFLNVTWPTYKKNHMSSYIEIQRIQENIWASLEAELPSDWQIEAFYAGVFVCVDEKDMSERDINDFANNVSYAYTVAGALEGKAQFIIELEPDFFIPYVKAHYEKSVAEAKKVTSSVFETMNIIEAMSEKEKAKLRQSLINYGLI